MGAFGDNLRREREMRGITLAEMSDSTKISKRWLKALEDEEFEILPGGVFNRGFVRSYARFLGIHEEQAVADYVTASHEQKPAEDKFPLEIHKKPDSPPLNPKRSMVPVALAVVALVLVVGGWTFWIKHKAAGTVATPQSASVPAANQPASSSKAPSSIPARPLEAAKSQAVQASENTDKSADEDVSNGGQENSTGPQNAPDGTELNAKEPSSGLKRDLSGSFSVVIKAKENSWISIAADGRTLWEGTLNANNQRSVTADKELVLKTGNAAGIDVSYNGKTLGALGKDKEVRTLTFNTAGLQQ